MNNIFRHTCKPVSTAIFIVMFLLVAACGSEETPETTEGLDITGVSIPAEINTWPGGSVTFAGKGFRAGDKIRLAPATDETATYIADVAEAAENSVTFVLPGGMETGRYHISVARGDKSLALGSAVFNIGVHAEIPDKEGMTVKGVVSAGGKGVPGVVVSDGHTVTKTDANGVYYLASDKKSGFVFISVPGNYEVTADVNAPQFFKRIGGAGTERKDFVLMPANNDKHAVLAMTDLHLADRNDDLSQFGGFLTDVNAVIAAYKAAGTKVYGLMLGDMTWDVYWYANSFSLSEYVPWMNKIDCPVFNLPGNHDNDPYRADDWLAGQPYRNVLGPEYYSFNIGKVHYVVLDNTEYTNAGASQGKIGDRGYNDRVTAAQIEWLKKDLAAVADKTAPVVLAMHIPLYRMPSAGNASAVELTGGRELIDCFAGFSDVHVLSGHTHINYTVPASASLIEHNTAAVCATWWWTGRTGYAGNHICRDGSPGGYGVYEWDNAAVKWHYKSIGRDKAYQFRAYDLNTVHITADKHAPSANATYAPKMAAYAGAYAQASSANEVLINVWGYDPQWNVEVRENNVPLTVTRVQASDPLHIISYEAKRLNVNAEPTSSFVTLRTTNMFRVTASSPNSVLEIKVTDRFGNVYSENMTRPKAFTLDMK